MSSKSLAKHRALRLSQNPSALSLEAVLDLVGQLRGMAGDLPVVAALLDAVENWAIARRDRRISDNTGLVYNLVIRRYSYVLETLGIPEEDAVQEGMMGLMKSAMLFDEARGFQFSTYATRLIKNIIVRLIEDDTIIRVPGYIQQSQRKAAMETGEDLEYLGWQKCLSLDRQWGDEEKSLANMAVDKSASGVVRHSDACNDLEPLLESLRPKDRLLIECRFLRNLTLTETAEEMHAAGHTLITRERVRQLQEEVLRMMRVRAGVLAEIQRKKRGA